MVKFAVTFVIANIFLYICTCNAIEDVKLIGNLKKLYFSLARYLQGLKKNFY